MTYTSTVDKSQKVGILVPWYPPRTALKNASFFRTSLSMELSVVAALPRGQRDPVAPVDPWSPWIRGEISFSILQVGRLIEDRFTNIMSFYSLDGKN